MKINPSLFVILAACSGSAVGAGLLLAFLGITSPGIALLLLGFTGSIGNFYLHMKHTPNLVGYHYRHTPADLTPDLKIPPIRFISSSKIAGGIPGGSRLDPPLKPASTAANDGKSEARAEVLNPSSAAPHTWEEYSKTLQEVKP